MHDTVAHILGRTRRQHRGVGSGGHESREDAVGACNGDVYQTVLFDGRDEASVGPGGRVRDGGARVGMRFDERGGGQDDGLQAII